MKNNLAFLILVLAISLLSINASASAELSNPHLGLWFEPSAGESFYGELDHEEVDAYKISNAFESKMPGAMGFRFRFAIDSTVLKRIREDGEFVWYAPEVGGFRAWHGALGSVLAAGDLVGLRVNKKGGGLEWFVDNSNHNGYRTVWKRPYMPARDPKVERARGVAGSEAIGYRRLFYEGQRDGQLTFRLETGEAPASVFNKEYLFPVETLPMVIRIQGMEAEISKVSSLGIRIRVLKPLNVTGVSFPVNGE